MTRVVAIVQARMGSTRFPGKCLADVAGRSMLARVVTRARRIDGVDDVMVATSTDASDDAIERAAQGMDVQVFRGDPANVLDRFARAASVASADVVVRLTADCPLLDPGVSAMVLQRLGDERADYASNVHPPTFPDGLDTEALTRETLELAWREATLASDLEHVTPFVWRQPERFRLASVSADRDFSAERWTVDRPDDLAFVSAILSAFPAEARDDVRWTDVVSLLAGRPDLAGRATAHRRNEGYVASQADQEGPAR